MIIINKNQFTTVATININCTTIILFSWSQDSCTNLVFNAYQQKVALVLLEHSPKNAEQNFKNFNISSQ